MSSTKRSKVTLEGIVIPVMGFPLNAYKSLTLTGSVNVISVSPLLAIPATKVHADGIVRWDNDVHPPKHAPFILVILVPKETEVNCVQYRNPRTQEQSYSLCQL